MRIQHNIMAMNAYRNLGINNKGLSKNLEKLSSGFRINRAGDDAAGLAISEKMRSQIAGLDQAQKNAQSGINMIQTAEGALTEVHDMLNRMVTLATQAANGTYVAEDQQKIQSEINALTQEIDRIATESNFNGQKLLNGDLAGAKVTNTEGSLASGGSAAVKAAFTLTLDTASLNITASTGTLKIGDKTYTNSTAGAVTGDALATQIKTLVNAQDVTIDGVVYTASTSDGKTITFEQKDAPSADGKAATELTAAVKAAVQANGSAVGATDANVSAVTEGKKAVDPTTAAVAAKTEIDFTGMTGANAIGGTVKLNGTTYEFVKDAGDVTGSNTAVVVAEDDDATEIATALKGKTGDTVGDFTATAADGKFTLTETTTSDSDVADLLTIEQENMGGLTLQIGANASETITVRVEKMDAASLGIDGASINVGDVDSANKAITAINAAIEKVSVQRSNLGAYQNRLEHTINNLGVMEENIQDAEATIRDTDIADEMMAYTKNNILIQSAQAMLAQANQVPQGVLQLMQ